MKIVFCLDTNIRFQLLLAVAIRTLRQTYPRADVCVISSGGKEGILDSLHDLNVHLVHYKPFLNESNVPAKYHRAIGAFLKLELAMVPELAEHDRVLYCDCDIIFNKPIDELFDMRPAYLAMAKEETIPFFSDYEILGYVHNERKYLIKMPFPIWYFNSGVVLFNLERFRKNGYIHNFLAFCQQNLHRLDNYDQPLLNYFFGKRITRFDQIFNCPPFLADSKSQGRIIHFQGPKPWQRGSNFLRDLQSGHYPFFCDMWYSHLTNQEKELVGKWEPKA